MTKKTAFLVVAAAVAAAVPARAQELTDAAFAASRAGFLALRAALPSASVRKAAAPTPQTPQTISYAGLAQSFASAPADAPAAFVGDWLQIAEASSPSEAGSYDPNGLHDGWNMNPEGLSVSVIPAKPPIQVEDAYQIAWGYLDPQKPGVQSGLFSGDPSPLSAGPRGGVLHIPAHMEDNPVTCVNCPDQGDQTHWVDDQTFEFRLTGAKKDSLLERATFGGTFDTKTGTASGGRVVYAGYRKR